MSAWVSWSDPVACTGYLRRRIHALLRYRHDPALEEDIVQEIWVRYLEGRHTPLDGIRLLWRTGNILARLGRRARAPRTNAAVEIAYKRTQSEPCPPDIHAMLSEIVERCTPEEQHALDLLATAGQGQRGIAITGIRRRLRRADAQQRTRRAA